jgi:hypothetical protein
MQEGRELLSRPFAGRSRSSVPSQRFAVVFRAERPAWRRCASLEYRLYSRSARLAIPAPRPEDFCESLTRHTGA